jgi:hypothetical protein
MQGKYRMSERLYGVLLHLYPKEFRAAYGPQMRLTFRDACRVAYRRNGAVGLLMLWLPTLLDLLKSALEERARQGEIMMSKERLIALAGPLTILVGAMWVVASIGEIVLLTGLGGADTTFWEYFNLIPSFLSLVPLLFALIGTRLRFQQSAGVPGRLGLALSVAGCAGMIVSLLASILLIRVAPEVDRPFWVNFMNYAGGFCLLSIMIGYILFGVDALRYRLLPRWNLSPLLLGSTLVFGFALGWFGRSMSPYAGAFLQLAITGVCWVLLGLAMAGVRRGHEPALAV